jgi:hypothetical protein
LELGKIQNLKNSPTPTTWKPIIQLTSATDEILLVNRSEVKFVLQTGLETERILTYNMFDNHAKKSEKQSFYELRTKKTTFVTKRCRCRGFCALLIV